MQGEDPSVVGEMAHIVARGETFTRGDYDGMSAEERDEYNNLILLCRIHHKQIDDQPESFTVERLAEIKAQHEQWVRSQLSPEDLSRQHDDEIYASYIEEFVSLARVDQWTTQSSWICSSSGPQMDIEYYDQLNVLGRWMLSRLCPHRHPELESAFTNFRRVLSDFLIVFSRHAEREQAGRWMITPRFYRSEVWLQTEVYDERVRAYEEHIALVEDLFLELTRALNFCFDFVRRYVLPSFRLREGAVLVERGPVGFDMHVERLRPEYRAAERTQQPYPGLEAFRDVRRTRDFYIHPDDEDFGDPLHSERA